MRAANHTAVYIFIHLRAGHGEKSRRTRCKCICTREARVLRPDYYYRLASLVAGLILRARLRAPRYIACRCARAASIKVGVDLDNAIEVLLSIRLYLGVGWGVGRCATVDWVVA